MGKKFLYGHEVGKYIDMAVEKMKEIYPWVKKEMFDDRNKFSIEKIGNRYQFICTYRWYDYERREIFKCNSEEFIDNIINIQRYAVENANEVKEVFVVPGNDGKVLTGWYLERYEFRSHKLGGYSVFVQAGDRVTGGSRTFFIPNSYFDGDFNEFLDKYCLLVPASFGFSKEELLNAPGLKEFLGY